MPPAAGLDVEKGVVGVGRIGEHPAKFHVGDACLDGLGVGFAGEQRVVVGFFARHVEQVLRVAHVVGDRRELADRIVEQLLFLTECLGVLRVVPDVRVFEFPVDFDQTKCLVVVVKDTPVGRPRACAGRPERLRSR
ncbi:hypothetical protein OKW42_007288 [Paraburkholderia sp. WC7.3d]